MYLADCIAKECDWDYLAEDFPTEQENEKLGRTLETLHVLHRHPDKYQELSGKDPAEALFKYREIYEAVKRLL